jgi:pimeloyl-ACP methyl ester carboxylesterase
VVLACLLISTGCNVHNLLEKKYERRFHRAGGLEHVVELPNGMVRYWSAGDGDPLLLIHGFGADALWQWHRQIRPLADSGFRVVAPDLLWFGGSVPHDPLYAVEDQVNTVLQLMDHLGIEKCDLLGVSYGGIVAFDIATRHPERVSRLILVDSPGPLMPRDAWWKQECAYRGPLRLVNLVHILDQVVKERRPQQILLLHTA